MSEGDSIRIGDGRMKTGGLFLYPSGQVVYTQSLLWETLISSESSMIVAAEAWHDSNLSYPSLPPSGHHPNFVEQ